MEKIYPHITFDSFDLIICVTLIGGFMTSNWIPALLALAAGLLVQLNRWITSPIEGR